MRRIPLRRRDGTIRAWTTVDDEDYERLSQWSWHLTPEGYVRRTDHSSGERVYMHRLLLGLAPGDCRQGDHVNRRPRDNRRSNLRIAEQGQRDNGQNRGMNRNNTSGYRGVTYHRKTRKWVAHVTLDRVCHYLGLYRTAGEAGAVAAAFRAERMPYSEEAVA